MNIYEKINEIAKQLGATKADGHNSQGKFGYDFIGYQIMEAKLRRLLPEIGLTITPEIIDLSENTTEFVTKNDYGTKTQQVIRTIVKMKFYITDTESGETIERGWYGADQDYGGKSCGQAITEACKRFSFKLFHVSTKEDKDPDGKTTTIERNHGSTTEAPRKQDNCPPGMKPSKTPIADEAIEKSKLIKDLSAEFKPLPKESQAKLKKKADKSMRAMTIEELKTFGKSIKTEFLYLDLLEELCHITKEHQTGIVEAAKKPLKDMTYEELLSFQVGLAEIQEIEANAIFNKKEGDK